MRNVRIVSTYCGLPFKHAIGLIQLFNYHQGSSINKQSVNLVGNVSSFVDVEISIMSDIRSLLYRQVNIILSTYLQDK